MSNTPDIQAQKDFYDGYWQALKPLSTYKVIRTKWIMDVLLQLRKRYKQEIKLLDLGCGDGRLVPLWQALTGAEAHGLDLSPQAMQVAAQQYPFVHYKAGDATSTGYADELFDIIICQEVLEHIEQQDALVTEAARILKKGGTLILTTPNKYYFDNRDGGNYSQQPIEQIINKAQLLCLFDAEFDLKSYTTLVYAAGDFGKYRLLTNSKWLGLLRRLRLEKAWKNRLLNSGYGLHQACVFIRK